MKIEYPKWIYHRTEAPKIVQTKAEHDQAGEGWEEAPFAVDQKPDETTQESTPVETSKTNEEIKNTDLLAMTNAQLKAALIAKGVAEEKVKNLKKDELIVMMGTI